MAIAIYFTYSIIIKSIIFFVIITIISLFQCQLFVCAGFNNCFEMSDMLIFNCRGLEFSSEILLQNYKMKSWTTQLKKNLKQSKAFVNLWGMFYIYLSSPWRKKHLHGVLIIVPYFNNRFVWWSHSFMIWLLSTETNPPLLMFLWTTINTVLSSCSVWRVNNALYTLLFSISSVSDDLWEFIDKERLTLLHILFICLIAF